MPKLFVFSLLFMLALPAFAEDRTAKDFMFEQFDQEAWHDPFFLQKESEAKREREAEERKKKLKELNRLEDDNAPAQNSANYQPEDFSGEDFRDLDVGKDIFQKFYMDVKLLESREPHDDDEPLARRSPDGGVSDKSSNSDLVDKYASDSDSRARGADDKSDWLPIRADLGQPPNIIQDLPGDWVPDKLDPIDNGGFAVSPDNGSPVPYRLNGHVDLQRVLPWDINN